MTEYKYKNLLKIGEQLDKKTFSETSCYKYKTLNDLIKRDTPGIDPLSLFTSPFLRELKGHIPVIKHPSDVDNSDVDNDE